MRYSDLDQMMREAEANDQRFWVHPNGFIQLKLDGTNERRLHFWGHPRIPRQRAFTTIHDHRFGFKSDVLAGRIMNVVYNTQTFKDDSLNDYEIWSSPGACKETDLAYTGDNCKLISNWPSIVNAGFHYVMQPWVFHESIPLQPSITLMTKIDPPKNPIAGMNPRVLVRRGRPYDHDFMRRKWATESEQKMLWSIVNEIIDENA